MKDERMSLPRNNGRIIYLSGGIDENIAQEVNIEMLRMQREDPLEDITLVVDSYGGDLFAAFAIADMMDIITCDIRTICIGKAMSAGQFIFSSGAKGKRFMSKHARLMVHNPIAGYEGSVPDIEIEVEELLKCRELFLTHMAVKSGNSVEFIKDLINRNRYIDTEEAIKLGFADQLITKIK